MDALLLIARVALGAVFVVAAAGKLADRRGTAEAVRSFGAPGALATPLAIALPLAELAVAGLLLFPATAVAGALGALALLAAFSAAIAVNLARGSTPDCHCFGRLHSEPIGAATLLRNALLAAAAVAVAAFGWDDAGASAVGWIGSVAPASFALGLGLGLLAAGWAAFELTRRYGRALRRVDQLEMALLEGGLGVPEQEDPPKLPVGSPAPPLPGMTDLLAPGRPLLVAFTSAGCGPCRELKARLLEWRTDHAGAVTFVELDYEAEERLADAYGVEGTPAAIVVGADRRVESAVAHGVVAIEELLEKTLLAHLPAPPDIGEPLPDLPLRSLGGERVGLRSALTEDRDTLMIFWNPGCGFCNAMRDDLRALEDASSGGPSLLIVATGDPDGVREARFSSPVLLDPMSLTSAAAGAGGTPTAILVGPDGTVRSAIAGGRDAVLELAGADGSGARDGLRVVMAGAAQEATG